MHRGGHHLGHTGGFLLLHAAHHLYAEDDECQHHEHRQHGGQHPFDAGEALVAGGGVAGVEAYVGGGYRAVDLGVEAVDIFEDGVAQQHLQLAADVLLQGQGWGGGVVVEEGVARDGGLAHGYVEDGDRILQFASGHMAVTGELGPELTIRSDGSVDMLGQHGREYTWVNPDDIIYTAA